MDIMDKIVIVTGGAGGIGQAICETLMKNGAKFIAIFDLVNPKSVVVKFEKTYGKHRSGFYSCDVSNTAEFTECFKKVVRAHKRVDILINNAGISKEIEGERMIDVNIKGTITGTFLALNHMGKHKSGHGGIVVNISSIAGLTNPAAAPIYSCTKHAIVGFTRSMKNHFPLTRVRVVVLCPGATLTSLGTDVSKYTLDIVTKEMMDEYTNIPWQRPENVASAVCDIIQYGQSGAVWVAENNAPPYEVKPNEHYSKMSIPIDKSPMNQ